VSWAPSQEISFGATFNYLFGTIDHAASQITQTSGTIGGTFTDRSTLSGVNLTAGMVITGLDRISEALRPFSLGLMITTRTNLHTTMETTYDFAPPPDAVPVRDTSAQTFGRVAVPFSYGFGIGTGRRNGGPSQPITAPSRGRERTSTELPRSESGTAIASGSVRSGPDRQS